MNFSIIITNAPSVKSKISDFFRQRLNSAAPGLNQGRLRFSVSL